MGIIINKKYKKIITGIFIFFSYFVFTESIFAQSDINIKNSPTKTKGIARQSGFLDQSLAEIVGQIVIIALSIIGTILLRYLVQGGYLWMTARDNEQQAEKAKMMLQGSIIGLVIVVGAYAITFFVVNLLTTGNESVRILDFNQE